jgi:hypothetical protein
MILEVGFGNLGETISHGFSILKVDSAKLKFHIPDIGYQMIVIDVAHLAVRLIEPLSIDR